ALQDTGFAPREAAAPPSDAPLDALPVAGALGYVAASASPLVTCPLEDLLGLVDQPNLPGSIDEHPNWRQRLPLPVDTLYADAAVAQRVSTIVRARETAPASTHESADSSPDASQNASTDTLSATPSGPPTP
ncbi:4-alpha-glucanotransferase, partial [Paraburkholderia sp. Ac-20347]|uniref:4-alpha-glucanotransferase n=1 Tax=Paraburkholderia sp. Ac-20347 TaxID=2703892 RepID=UPI00197E0C3C